ncbi:hypothetical protein D3C72_1808670 [compost metagenome]
MIARETVVTSPPNDRYMAEFDKRMTFCDRLKSDKMLLAISPTFRSASSELKT